MLHLVRNTFGMLLVLSVLSRFLACPFRLLVFAFDLDSKEASRGGLFDN